MQINLAPDLSLLAIMGIFLLNYLIVRKFFLQPINEVLEARETETRSAERLYEESLQRFNEATAKTESELHAARKAAAQLRDRFRAEAAAHRQQVVEKTGTEARQIVTEADQALAAQIEEARRQIARDSDSLARTAAERILGRAV